jgi:phosphate binding protein
MPDVALALRPTIVVRLKIDATGAVTDAKVYRSRLELAAFEEAALDAAARFRFAPALRAGRAVAAWINWPVGFGERAAAAESIRIKGSDTIGGALGPALGEGFEERRPGVDVTVEALGSSTAFVGLFDGSADLGASSRPIDEAELAEARRLGVSFEEIVIGYDGIAVIVHPDNPLVGLSVDQVARIYTGEVTRWSELGGRDAPIKRYSRPDYSGTHQFFRDKVLRRGDSHGDEEFAAGTAWIEESRALVERVAADPDAIGYVGLGWVGAGVRALRLAPGEGASVAPSPATVRDGTYPVYRPLLVYTRGRPVGAVAAFLRFVLSADGQALVDAHGFIRSDVDPDAVIPAAAEHERPAADDRALAARIRFAGGGARLTRSAGLEVDAVAREAIASERSVLVIGHADAEGDRGDNDELAARRAEVVAWRLRRAGVPAERIVAESAGASAPVASNQDRAGRHRNRRVDLFLVRITPSCGSSSQPCSPPP